MNIKGDEEEEGRLNTISFSFEEESGKILSETRFESRIKEFRDDREEGREEKTLENTRRERERDSEQQGIF